jgi:hypothetical protein
MNMISLIKQINEELEQSIAVNLQETATAVAAIKSNVVGFAKSRELFETAEEFLMQLSTMISAGKLDPNIIDRSASELAALQLLSQPDTSGAFLSKIKGDPTKNLATIMKSATKPSDNPGKVDQVLVQIAQSVGKSLSDSNKQTLTQLGQMDGQQKQQFVQKLQQLATYYRQAAGKAAPPDQQTPPQNNNPSPSGNGGGGVPPGV